MEKKKIKPGENRASTREPGIISKGVTKASFIKAGRGDPCEYLEKEHSRKSERQKQRPRGGNRSAFPGSVRSRL